MKTHRFIALAAAALLAAGTPQGVAYHVSVEFLDYSGFPVQENKRDSIDLDTSRTWGNIKLTVREVGGYSLKAGGINGSLVLEGTEGFSRASLALHNGLTEGEGRFHFSGTIIVNSGWTGVTFSEAIIASGTRVVVNRRASRPTEVALGSFWGTESTISDQGTVWNLTEKDLNEPLVSASYTTNDPSRKCTFRMDANGSSFVKFNFSKGLLHRLATDPDAFLQIYDPEMFYCRDSAAKRYYVDGVLIDESLYSVTFNKATGRFEVLYVPEPSAFGLLAGLSAAVFAAARRRRRG